VIDDDTDGGYIPDDDEPTGRDLAPRRKRTRTERLLEGEAILRADRAGVPPVETCLRLGISRPTYYRRLDEARRFVLDPTVEQYRADAAGRLAMGRRVVVETLTRTERTLLDPETGEMVSVQTATPAEVAALVGRWVQIEETEAKLRGAFAPTKVDHTVTVRDALDVLAEQLGMNDPQEATR